MAWSCGQKSNILSQVRFNFRLAKRIGLLENKNCFWCEVVLHLRLPKWPSQPLHLPWNARSDRWLCQHQIHRPIQSVRWQFNGPPHRETSSLHEERRFSQSHGMLLFHRARLRKQCSQNGNHSHLRFKVLEIHNKLSNNLVSKVLDHKRGLSR